MVAIAVRAVDAVRAARAVRCKCVLCSRGDHGWSRILLGEVHISWPEERVRPGSTNRVGTVTPIGFGQVPCVMCQAKPGVVALYIALQDIMHVHMMMSTRRDG
jgi:hypothetical protein